MKFCCLGDLPDSRMDCYKPFTAWSLFTPANTSRLIEEYPEVVPEERNVSLDLSLSLCFISAATNEGKEICCRKDFQVGEVDYNDDHYQKKQLKIEIEKSCEEKNSQDSCSERSDVSLELSLSGGNVWMSKGKGKSPVNDHTQRRFEIGECSGQNQKKREENNVNNGPKIRDFLNLGLDDDHPSKKRERMENASCSTNKRNKAERDQEKEEEVDDPWCIKKRLTESDLGHLSRLLLSAESVKAHVLPFWNDDQIAKIKEKEGLPLSVYDCDTMTEHNLVFKLWHGKANVLNNNWVKGFVQRRELKLGDEIGLYWDGCSSRLNFSVLNRAAMI